MLRLLDRYVIREIVLPSILGLVVLTFVLEITPILREGEALIARGVEWTVIARVLMTLLPQALSVTIPMAVLLGILVGFGRLAADREFVAMQACGVSLLRLLRPVALIAIIAIVWALLMGVGILINLPYLFLLPGFLFGVLAATIYFGRRAERAAYLSIEGQPGAAAAVLQAMRGGWFTKPAIVFNRQIGRAHV